MASESASETTNMEGALNRPADRGKAAHFVAQRRHGHGNVAMIVVLSSYGDRIFVLEATPWPAATGG
jgi:hypothetical protein